MRTPIRHISVCICTFKRPNLLEKLLSGLAVQNTDGFFTFSIVIVDNDRLQSGMPAVISFSRTSSILVTYCVEPLQNLALARNRALAQAKGAFIAFIDDDEYPSPNWLLNLYLEAQKCGVHGVLGPVTPYFETPPPDWIFRGRIYDRPTHPTGFKISGHDMRTSNLLFRRNILLRLEEAFRTEFGSGGEDVDFLQRLVATGCIFTWCNEATVYELIPEARIRRSYIFRRAFHRGNNTFKLREGRGKSLFKALIALPLYCVLLPFLAVAGDHFFMTYVMKICDHAGLLLAFCGVRPFAHYK